MTPEDLAFLTRCADLAEEALDAGDEPFGSLLVGADGTVLREERNREGEGDATAHPEIALARWAAAHVAPEDRAACVVHTSGEHCPMCSAAHAWVGLGRIVVAVTSAQLVAWRTELGAGPSPVAALPIRDVAPGLEVDGPAPELADRMRALHARALARG